MRRHIEFIAVFLLYWKANRFTYALRTAKRIAYDGLPF